MTVEKILLKYDPVPSNLLPALKDISAVFGFVSKKDAQKAADYFSLPLAKIFETASFYDSVKIRKEPDLIIEVCSGGNCVTKEAFQIIREIENCFKIKAGDEFNPKVRLKVISCLGRCGAGPIVVINDKVYERVTTSGLHAILKEWV